MNTTQRVNAFVKDLGISKSEAVNLVIAELRSETSAKVTTKAPKGKASKGSKKAAKAAKPTGDQVVTASKSGKSAYVATTGFVFQGRYEGTGARKLKGGTKGNRLTFIRDHSWATDGMSTRTLRSLVQGGAKVAKGWTVAV